MATAQRNGKVDTTDVSAQIDTIREDIAGLHRMIGTLAEEKTDDLKADARHKAEDVAARAARATETAQDRAADAERAARLQAEAAWSNAETVVRRQPAMSMGAAAGIGFLVGLMAARRS